MKRIAINGIGIVLSLGLLGLSAAAQAPASGTDSSNGSSLGDYAKQIRKSPSTQQKKVFDNDNLPTDDKLSIVGPPPAQHDNTKSDSPDTNSASEAKTSTETKATNDTKASPEGKPAESKSTDDKTSDNKTSTDSAAKSDAAAKTDSSTKTDSKASDKDAAAKQQAIKQWTDKLTSQKQQIDLAARELDVLQREYQIRAAAMYADAGNRMRNQADWDKQDADYKQQIADKQKALEDAKSKMDDMQEDARKAGVPASARDDASGTAPAAQ
jgi:hypothetical protein